MGRRRKMEDAIVILGLGPLIQEDEDLIALFDGHGGLEVASFLAKNFHKKLRYNLTQHPDPKEALRTTFLDMDQSFTKEKMCGSTAVVAYLKSQHLYIANCGDSRAVLGIKNFPPQRVSFDHKPSVLSEQKRIQEAGGVVIKLGETYRVNAVLSVTRAFGDFDLKPSVTVDPFIYELDLDEENDYLILACDGIWDVMSDEDAIDLVRSQGSPFKGALLLTQTAFEKGSTDNLSAIVIKLSST
uniref:PPM-type phosphatase domain-containing protein n=1 Tax=Arcella intermedia TaxID=1963864 RepID=A0A6B2LFY3_9EUKA